MLTKEPVDVGTQVTVSVSITERDDPDSYVDPTTLTLRVLPPKSVDYTLTYGVDLALVRDSGGKYHVDIKLDRAGTWNLRWKGQGTAFFAKEAQIEVRASAFQNP